MLAVGQHEPKMDNFYKLFNSFQVRFLFLVYIFSWIPKTGFNQILFTLVFGWDFVEDNSSKKASQSRMLFACFPKLNVCKGIDGSWEGKAKKNQIEN